MSSPLKRGDRARVLRGLAGAKSPNAGLVVEVGLRVYGNLGDDSRFGPVVECHHPDLASYDQMGAVVKTGKADVPIAWLQKIELDASPLATETKREELTHD